MTTSPIVPRHNLDVPGSIKILLSKAASDAIAANGDYHIAFISHPDCTSPPESHGRMILACVPASRDRLNAACRVIRGTHRAAPIRKPVAPAPGAAISKPAPSPP